MRFAALLCIVLSAAAASATADPLDIGNDPADIAATDALHGLPIESKVITPGSPEASALQEMEPSANYIEIESAVARCAMEVSRSKAISEDAARRRCTTLLLGP